MWPPDLLKEALKRKIETAFLSVSVTFDGYLCDVQVQLVSFMLAS